MKSSIGRWLLVANTGIASFGVLLSFTLCTIGYYAKDIDPRYPTLYGNLLTGKDDVWERWFDWISYFTIISNILVAAILFLLVARRDWFDGDSSRAKWLRGLRIDSVMMIAVTGIIYNLLLATGDQQGWDWVSNFFQHNLTPAVTVLVFLFVGPRGLTDWGSIARSLALPITWLVAVFLRGQAIHAYPYGFLDVATYGWSSVLSFTAGILVFAFLLIASIHGFDVAATRRTRSQADR